MTIHSEHPFHDPDPDPARRLRGRLGGAVTLWTSAAEVRAGLTVSSLMVAPGEPARVLALIDPDSELAETLATSGQAVLQLLQWRHRWVAEVFAGLAPAPGGPFAQARFAETPWGPRLTDASSWAGLRVQDSRELGWSLLVTCAVEHLELAEEDEPLVHRRGRYQRPL